MIRPTRPKVAIISRSFWPKYPVIGEALLKLAERFAENGNKVCVILQKNPDLDEMLIKGQRGTGVDFYTTPISTNSSSNIFIRTLEAIFFTLWVLISLIWIRPEKIYVSTDPPVTVPAAVMLYCTAFKAQYIYHLQDIHPEATNTVYPINKFIMKILIALDCLSIRRASQIITLTKEMAYEIKRRANPKVTISILENPSASVDHIITKNDTTDGFAFCGNAGRLQRIPLLTEAIDNYLSKNGRMSFIFIGGGIYSHLLEAMDAKHETFTYLGFRDSEQATKICSQYSWALLPIEDEVTRFAFPSKSSTYLISNSNILAICGKETSVAKWVLLNRLGLIVEPEADKIVETFFQIERMRGRRVRKNTITSETKKYYSIETFSNHLFEFLNNKV